MACLKLVFFSMRALNGSSQRLHRRQRELLWELIPLILFGTRCWLLSDMETHTLQSSLSGTLLNYSEMIRTLELIRVVPLSEVVQVGSP